MAPKLGRCSKARVSVLHADLHKEMVTCEGWAPTLVHARRTDGHGGPACRPPAPGGCAMTTAKPSQVTCEACIAARGDR